ncbi:MAG TPA: hypothetical protein VJI46_01380 [Candidatus Nanoarchaeia archaeon]|nr:hypothetical protein [Candidatus Nanoarchaeia archaeon]
MVKIAIVGAYDPKGVLSVELHEGFMRNIEFHSIPPSIVYYFLRGIGISIPMDNLKKVKEECQYLLQRKKGNKDVEGLLAELNKMNIK